MGKSSATWLSQGAEVLARRVSEQQDEGTVHCDVLIVGSGYGGAVAAARLAGCTVEDAAATGGRRKAVIWLLERGREHLPGSFPSRFAELPGEVRFSLQDGKPARGNAEGLFDVRVGDDVNVLVGNGLGGGSLINAAVMKRASPEVFDDGWPIDWPAVEGGYVSAEAMLEVQDVQGDAASSPKLAALDAAAAALHRKGTGAPRRAEPLRLAIHMSDARTTDDGLQIKPCTQCGDCVTGCNQRAKRSLDTNYLVHAWRRGVEMFCGSTVERLAARPSGNGRMWLVTWHYSQPGQRPASAEMPKIRARRVILAAGSLGSTEILLRSCRPTGREGEDALEVSGQVMGTRFSTNGDMIAVGYAQKEVVHACGREEDDPGDTRAPRGVGPTITGMVQVPRARDESGPAFAVTEFAIPAALRRVFEEVVTTFGHVHQLAGSAKGGYAEGKPEADPLAVQPHHVDRTAVYGLMGDDGAAGRLELPPGLALAGGPDGAIAIRWEGVGRHPLFQRQIEVLGLAVAHAGGTLLPNPIWRPIPPGAPEAFRPSDGAVTTVHPLGGCPMGRDASDGVVNDAGCVFRGQGDAVHDDLVVLDGSIVRRALGVNPALTIAALAEQAVPMLMDLWEMVPGQERPRALPLVPDMPAGWETNRDGAHTAWRIREQLTGDLIFPDGATFACELELEAQPMLDENAHPDMRQWLARMSRRLVLRRGELRLYGDAHAESWGKGMRRELVASLPVEGEVQVFRREYASIHNREMESLREYVAHVLAEGSVEGETSSLLDRVFRDCAAANLARHVREVRGITYHLQVIKGVHGLRAGSRIVGRKRLDKKADIETRTTGERRDFWHQITHLQMRYEPTRGRGLDMGTLETDLRYFVQHDHPLISIAQQSDQPNAIADLASLGLFTLRLVLKQHVMDLLRLGDTPVRIAGRIPGEVRGQQPTLVPLEGGAVLRHYRAASGATTLGRPVLLVHGYGASGSTFTHPQIGISMAAYLLGGGDGVAQRHRDVWVLELRTSVALPMPTSPPGFEEVAQDIVAALRHIRTRAGADTRTKVDVVAHCLGAAMFCVAMLKSDDAHEAVGAAVLSQVGPLLRVSPWNQLRGYLASYLLQFASIRTLDTRPGCELADAGCWNPGQTGVGQELLDRVLAMLPYAPGDLETIRLDTLRRAGKGPLVDFRRVRRRTDAIFGQTVHLPNLSDEMLLELDAIFGGVQVSTFAQTIHYARERLLTDARGRNRLLNDDGLKQRFNFPVLLLHGGRNLMFDWRGSLDSWGLLCSVFGDGADSKALFERSHREDVLLGADTPRQLLLLAGYGHQDSLIGSLAYQYVFPKIERFLNQWEDLPPTSPGVPSLPQCTAPWMGPLLGHLRSADADPDRLILSLLVHGQGRYTRLDDVLIIGMNKEGDRWEPDRNHVYGLRQTFLGDSALDLAEALEREPLTIAFSRSCASRFDAFAVLALHHNQPLPQTADRVGVLAMGPVPAVCINGRRLTGEELDGVMVAVQGYFSQRDDLGLERTDECCFFLGEPVLRAADLGRPTSNPAPIAFAFGSCQYPAGLLDRPCAQRSLARLARELGTPSAPQFLLLIGDQVYVDAHAGLFDPVTEWNHGADHAYELNWRLPAFRAVTARLPTYMMLDDHEVLDNWQPPVHRDLDPQESRALDAYRRHQGKLSPNPDASGGDHGYTFAPSGVPFFVLDTRTRRQVRTVHAADSTTSVLDAGIIPDSRMTELLNWLTEHRALPVKFIVSPSAILPPERFSNDRWEERLRSDGWSGYPASLTRLLHHIEQNQIHGVVLLSGDLHVSTVCKLTMGEVTVFSVVSSGWYAPWPFAAACPEDWVQNGALDIQLPRLHRVVGEMSTAAVSTRSGYARVSVDAGATLHVSLCAEDGSTIDVRHSLAPGRARWQVTRA